MIVRTIKVKEGKGLVEWSANGHLFRAWVPAEDMDAISNDVDDPERGLSYGDDFEHFLKDVPTAKDIAQALNDQALWTFDDVQANPSVALTALAQAYGKIVTQLLTAMKGD